MGRARAAGHGEIQKVQSKMYQAESKHIQDHRNFHVACMLHIISAHPHLSSTWLIWREITLHVAFGGRGRQAVSRQNYGRYYLRVRKCYRRYSTALLDPMTLHLTPDTRTIRIRIQKNSLLYIGGLFF